MLFRRAVIVVAILAIASQGYAQTAKSPASAKASAGPRPATVRGSDVNRQNPDGSTPLQWAVYNGDVAEAKRLLRAGADVTIANKYGASPMTLCLLYTSPSPRDS